MQTLQHRISRWELFCKEVFLRKLISKLETLFTKKRTLTQVFFKDFGDTFTEQLLVAAFLAV